MNKMNPNLGLLVLILSQCLSSIWDSYMNISLDRGIYSHDAFARPIKITSQHYLIPSLSGTVTWGRSKCATNIVTFN